ncbi:MAG: SAM-dependent methyltransferase, partial [Myxococcota bacterium]
MAKQTKKKTSAGAKVLRLVERRRKPIAVRDHALTAERQAYFEARADVESTKTAAKRYYDERLFRMVRFNVPAGLRVLEIGSGLGDLLGAVKPTFGVGVDFSPKMVAQARRRHPDLHFVVGDAADLPIKGGTFDAIILSNLVGDLVDVQRVLEQLPSVCTPETRIIVSHYNYAWEPFVRLSEMLGIRRKHPEQNWLRTDDLKALLHLADLDTVKTGRNLLAPLPGFISTKINNYLGTLPGLSQLCLNEYVVGRMAPRPRDRDYKVTVIVACKDERGNIEEIVRTVPKMGTGTELIFCDGHSTDGTIEEIERCIAHASELNPDLDDIKLMIQPTTGKGEAVFMGFDAAEGDILMILDADITVRSEELP